MAIRTVHLRQQLQVCARGRGAATSSTGVKFQDEALRQVQHHRALPVRPKMPVHPRLCHARNTCDCRYPDEPPRLATMAKSRVEQRLANVRAPKPVRLLRWRDDASSSAGVARGDAAAVLHACSGVTELFSTACAKHHPVRSDVIRPAVSSSLSFATFSHVAVPASARGWSPAVASGASVAMRACSASAHHTVATCARQPYEPGSNVLGGS